MDWRDRYAAGLAHAVEGRLEPAVEALSRALVEQPDNAEGHNNLGLVLQRLGRPEEALASFRRALRIRPAYAMALTNLGAALAGLGRHDEAIGCYAAALDLEPADLAAANNLAAALHALGRDDEAVGRLRGLIAAAPDFVDAHINLGAILRKTDQLPEAIDLYRAAVRLRPEDAALRLIVAHLLLDTGRHGEAREHFSRVIDADLQSAPAHAGLGKVLQELGDIGGARAAFRRAIAADPKGFGYYLSLAHISRLDADDPALVAMLSLAGQIDSLSDDDQINAHYGLGKSLADIGRHDEGFAHLLAGAAVKRRHTDYDEARALGGLRRIRTSLSAERLQTWPRADDARAAPIFIVGMPRSGSTLVEQILARHPRIACAGETNALRNVLRGYHAEAPGWRYPDADFIPTAADLSAIADRYLKTLAEEIGPQADDGQPIQITNKLLSNFRHIGLITRVFPGAKIIHTFRNPIDTCLSCFSINFASQPFAHDLGELGRYYRGYAELMRHWRRILPPETIFDVRYEAVVQNTEASARAILAHCGLDWHDDCLRFYEADRPVKTASVEQVRRPIYSGSTRRWRPDDATLRPLLDGLGLASAI